MSYLLRFFTSTTAAGLLVLGGWQLSENEPWWAVSNVALAGLLLALLTRRCDACPPKA